MTRQAVSDDVARQSSEDVDPDVAAIRAMLRNADISPEERAQPETQGVDGSAAATTAPKPRSDDLIGTHVKTALQNAAMEALGAHDDTRAEPTASAGGAGESSHAMHQPKRQAKKPRGRHASKLTRETGKTLALLARFMWQVICHPRTPRVLAGVVIALVIVARPLFVLGLALFALTVGTITYFSLGPDAVDRLIARWFERLQARDPAKAERLHGRAVRVISTLNRIIDRLPDRWTSGLYLPDLEPPQDPPEKMQSDPFERLEPAPGARPVVRKAHPAATPALDDPRSRTSRPVNPSDPSARRRPPRQLRP